MVQRIRGPGLKRLTAFLCVRLVPVLRKPVRTADRGPPCTAIYHLLASVGPCVEDHVGQFKRALQEVPPLDTESKELQRVDVRYVARMPEAKMETLVTTWWTRRDGPYCTGSYKEQTAP